MEGLSLNIEGEPREAQSHDMTVGKGNDGPYARLVFHKPLARLGGIFSHQVSTKFVIVFQRSKDRHGECRNDTRRAFHICIAGRSQRMG